MTDAQRSQRWWHPLRQLLDARERRWGLVLLLLAAASMVVELVGASSVFALLAALGSDDPGLVLPVVGAVTLPGLGSGQLRTGLVTGILVFFVLRSGFLVGRAYVEARIVSTLTVRVAERLLDGYLAMPYLFHTQRNSADLMRNTFTSTQQLGSYLNQAVLLLTNSVLAVGLTVLLVATDPLTAGIAALTLGAGVVLVQRLLQPRLEVWGRLANEAIAGSMQAIQQALGGIRDIKILGTGPAFSAAHGRHRRRMARSGYLSSAGSSLPRSVIELGLVTTVLVALLVATRTRTPVADVLPTLGLFAYAGVRLQPALQLVVGARNSLRYTEPVIRDLARDRQDIDRWVNRPPTPDGHDQLPAPPSEIRLEDVSFSYGADASGARAALDGVSIAIRHGDFIGICGPTGGGKSTLLDVLVGLLEPTSGRVVVDGRPLGPEPAWWWRHLGVVSQQVFLTDDTLRANIAFGLAPDDVDEERLRTVVEQAQLSEVIRDLPAGLDTVVGERGVRLSGGQRQRVALARALYRDAAVLVLDEGTSALDTATEAAAMAAIATDSAQRTLIAVAHRLGTIRDADRILVLEHGRIAAMGRWDELHRTSAAFRSLADAGRSE